MSDREPPSPPRQSMNGYPDGSTTKRGHTGSIHGRFSSRPGWPDQCLLEALDLDAFARLTLALMRWHFQTFAAPETQGWLLALRCATTHVGPHRAAPLCYDIVALVQALRAARMSPFQFNPEGCACCRIWLTPEERLLMEMIDALRHGQTGRARILAQLLCDGVPSDELIAVAENFSCRHAPASTPRTDATSVQT